MNKEQKKEYNKTWYYKITLPNKMSPNNWITGTPIRLFGKVILVRWKIARANYKWNNL